MSRNRTLEQTQALRDLGAEEPYPSVDYSARWLIAYLREGINAPETDATQRLRILKQMQKLVQGKRVYCLRRRKGTSIEFGVIKHITGRPPVDLEHSKIGNSIDCPLQAFVDFDRHGTKFVSLDLLVLEGTDKPIWPAEQSA